MPSQRYAWYVVGVLTFTYLISYADRQMLTLLIEPIRHALHIRDTEIGLLAGFAFAIFYTIMGLPIAWLADQYSRRKIIAAGAFLWSLMTAGCGFAKNFGQMFSLRIGVGVGEAALTPSAFSMIADYFPPERLGKAIGFYMAGGALGAGLALVVGGAVLALLHGIPQVVLPIIGSVPPWRLAFIIISLPGLLALMLIATIKEPLRRRGDFQEEDDQDKMELKSPLEAIRYLCLHWQTYVPLLGGFAVLSLMKAAVLTWTPTFYIRTWGWSASSIGYVFGVFLLIFSPLGAIGGGWFTDRLCQRGHMDGPIRVLIVTGIITAVAATLMPLMPTAGTSLVFLAVLPLLLFIIGAVAPAAFQLVTPNRFRAQVAAISLFINNMLGIGFGPTLVGMITDFGFNNPMDLRYSLAIVAGVFTPLGSLIFYSGLRAYRHEMHTIRNASTVRA